MINMEREIKFRGERIDNKEWVYGYLIVRKLDGIKKYYIYDNSIDEVEINEYCNSADYMEPVNLRDLFIKVIPESVGQFTGLKDKNGKEIYEKDIVTFDHIKTNGEVQKNVICIIEWTVLGEFVMRDKNNISYMPGMIPEQLKIIGNKFQNPELLK